jgi:hypothetical protein
MASTQHFDYDDFVRKFRAACARRGIDPQEGASGYQIVHITAQQRHEARPIDRWWLQNDLWRDDPPYHSETEQGAIWLLFRQTYLIELRCITSQRRLQRGIMALRELHQVQVRRKQN